MNEVKNVSVSISSLDFRNPQSLRDLLEKPAVVLAEFLTGVLAPGLNGIGVPTEYTLSAGRIVQAWMKRNCFEQIGRELKKYREEGKIKEDYFATNNAQSSLKDLLEFVDTNVPDEELFKAIKSIFFNSIAIDADSKKELLAYQLLQVCKQLKSIDILILKNCYKIYQEDNPLYQDVNDFTNWQNKLAERMGIDYPEIVGAEDDKLVQLGLLSGRGYSDKSGIRAGRDFRLSRLGLKLCEFITNWE